eukprot:7336023-Pyramimonas_sp.AAC.2
MAPRFASLSQGPPPRAMNWQIPLEAPWPPPEACAAEGLQDLCKVLARTAVNREVLVAVST